MSVVDRAQADCTQEFAQINHPYTARIRNRSIGVFAGNPTEHGL